jgi:hypothetical protein
MGLRSRFTEWFDIVSGRRIEAARDAFRLLMEDNALMRAKLDDLRKVRESNEASFLDELTYEIAREKHACAVSQAKAMNASSSPSSYAAQSWESFRLATLGQARAEARLIMAYAPIARLLAEKALREVEASKRAQA